jgi:membrane protease YdiL (CAAX protease family)
VDSQEHERRDLFELGGLFRGAAAYAARTPWSAGRALLATTAIVGLSIAVGLAALWLLRGGTTHIGLGGPRGAADDTAGLHLFAMWQLAVVVLTLFASRLFGGRITEVLALKPSAGGWRSYVGAVLLLALLQTVLSAVQYATRSGDLYVDLRPFVDLVRGPNWGLAATVIGLGAPLSEELLFRGFLLSALAKTRLRFWGGAILASGFWTVLHAGYSAVGVLEVFLVGLLFSWLLWRTGSLRVPIFCHAVYNTLIVLALRFADLPAPT